MNLDFLRDNNLKRGHKEKEDEIKKDGIENFIQELKDTLEVKYYTIDRFEGDIAVCQDRETKEILNISKNNLPKDIEEGQILKLKNNSFEIDYDKTEEAQNRVKNKFDRLMKKKDEQ